MLIPQDFLKIAKGRMSKKSLDYSSKEDGYASRYTAWTVMKRRIVR
jgi:hypothetical protein